MRIIQSARKPKFYSKILNIIFPILLIIYHNNGNRAGVELVINSTDLLFVFRIPQKVVTYNYFTKWVLCFYKITISALFRSKIA
ncbi:unnamed protein product [Moneuplotes crassus]|uniref:Uncharacterized protein n=1 Tax=Euplotes crassus TaxID=5936 RepID=A0AAD1XVM4_EUPCR|nr:unnamed protein product [Moneuplotes crassus]